MSKSNGWVAIDKMLARELPICGRAYTKLEAMFSYSVDQDNGVTGSIKGYAKLWNWSRNKVRKFLEEIRTPKGHPGDTRGTPKGHPFHFIDTGLREQKDTQRTLEGHPRDTQRTPTNNPNPNPKKNTIVKKFSVNDYRPEWIPLKDWSDLVEHRKKKKSTETERAYKILIGELKKATDKGFSVTECIDQIVSRNWTGFKADWLKKDNNNAENKSRWI